MSRFIFFFFNDTATTEIYTLSLHDALPIFSGRMPETIEQCRKTIELAPAAGTAYAVLSMAYAQMGQQAETLRAAEDTVRISGDSPSLTATAAWALAHIGQSGKAKQLLAKALEQAKEH